MASLFHNDSLWQMRLILSKVCHADMEGFPWLEFGNFFLRPSTTFVGFDLCVSTQNIPPSSQTTNTSVSDIFGIVTGLATQMSKAYLSRIRSLFSRFLHACSTETEMNLVVCWSSFITEISATNLPYSGTASRSFGEICRVHRSRNDVPIKMITAIATITPNHNREILIRFIKYSGITSFNCSVWLDVDLGQCLFIVVETAFLHLRDKESARTKLGLAPV